MEKDGPDHPEPIKSAPLARMIKLGGGHTDDGSGESWVETENEMNGDTSRDDARRAKSVEDRSWEPEDQADGFKGLDELDAPPPDEHPHDRQSSHSSRLEDVRSRSRRRFNSKTSSTAAVSTDQLLVKLYTYSWLILFSIFGTLARLGMQWITRYPNAPVATNELWANVGGCFVMGFLMEDRALFRPAPKKRNSEQTPSVDAHTPATDERLDQIKREFEKRQATKAHITHKKTLPLYIGLTVGFCGSYTSFSSFMRDAYLALANELALPNAGPAARSAGWSVCAFFAVIIAEPGLSLAALSVGAHVSEALMPILNRIPAIRASRFLNPIGAILGLGCWLGAVFLAIWPPQDQWRADCVFAIVFAPPGCLLRFWLAVQLNSRVPRFPLGTFAANILGSMILAMAYNLQHAPLGSADGLVGGGLIGCQVLQGMMDGFCGCLTTVSTWVVELQGLRKRHAYEYGIASIAVGFAFMLIIIGSLQWTIGLSRTVCTP